MTKFDQLVDSLILETPKGQEEQVVIAIREMKKSLILIETNRFGAGNFKDFISGRLQSHIRQAQTKKSNIAQGLQAFFDFLVFVKLEPRVSFDFDIDMDDAFKFLEMLAFNYAFAKGNSGLIDQKEKTIRHPIPKQSLLMYLSEFFSRHFENFSFEDVQNTFNIIFQPLLQKAGQDEKTRKKLFKIITTVEPILQGSPFDITPDDPPNRRSQRGPEGPIINNPSVRDTLRRAASRLGESD